MGREEGRREEDSSADPLATRTSWLGLPLRCPLEASGHNCGRLFPILAGTGKVAKRNLNQEIKKQVTHSGRRAS